MAQDKIRGWSFILQSHHQKIIENLGLSLKPATVLIADLGSSTLGLWHVGSRVIEVSESLISHYSWDEIEHTLKHEMAHQIVDEIYSVKEKPHGKCFKDACRLLGISSEATVSRSSLEESAMKKRISKLLALSTSSNENEAASALAKAHELSCKHNLTLIDEEKGNFNILPIGGIRKKIPRYEHTIIGILNEFYFVKALQNFRLDDRGEKVGWQFELYGDLDNLSTAEYVYYFLVNQGSSLWLNYKKLHGSEVSRKKRFFLTGLYDGFYKKLRQERDDILHKFSLQKIHDVKLDGFFSKINPSVRRRTIRQNVDPKIYNDGIAEGKELRIHHGVGTKSTGRSPRFIEG